MTQQEKQLLLKDLCARLPYGVKVCAGFNTGNRYNAEITAISLDRDYVQIRQNDLHPYTGSSIEDIRPYLRPMSSMTDEEIDRMWDIYERGSAAESSVAVTEYLYERNLDCHHLIERGLALEAKEGMYKTE